MSRREYSQRYYQKNKHRWHKPTPEAQRAYNLRRKYGVSLEEVEQMKITQKGMCAICNGSPSERGLFVDHDHVTGKIRGLLCQNCNMAIGHLKDDPARADRAARYLRERK